MSTDEFSFVLKPSLIKGAGVGVFATHDINNGEHLLVTPVDENDPRNPIDLMRKIYKDSELLKDERAMALINTYGIDWGEFYRVPPRFNQMMVGWYLNHSENPNISRRENGKWYACRDIKKGEELLANYNKLSPDEEKRNSKY